MAEQLGLPLPVRAATGRNDFFVAPSNALALAEIDRWQDWPARKLILIGPKGSGKSHLARVWAHEADARLLPAQALLDAPEAAGLTPATDVRNLVVEDVERLANAPQAEQALFHLHNLTLAEGKHLLLTTALSPHRWTFSLPDLTSRLQGTPSAELEPPDDQLLAALLMKLFLDRGITPTASLIPWLVTRMDRSFDEAGRLVAEIDARALATGRAIGPRLAAEVIDNRPVP